LRTPLTSITAWVDMIRETDPGTVLEELPELLDVLSRNSGTLRQIVDQLLDLAALEGEHSTLVREPADLAAIVRDAVEAATPAATAAGVTLTLELPAELATIGDSARLRTVADHLIDNAVKHTIDGGDVTVTLTRALASIVELSVTDTGIGVPDDEADRLFGRFYRTRRTREHRIPGNGLGLAISRAIVQGHRGSIQLLPTAGHGTRVVVRLPAS